jgi:hypothetical protein
MLLCLQDTRTLLAFVATEVGGVRAVGWQLVPSRRAINTPGAGEWCSAHMHCTEQQFLEAPGDSEC